MDGCIFMDSLVLHEWQVFPRNRPSIFPRSAFGNSQIRSIRMWSVEWLEWLGTSSTPRTSLLPSSALHPSQSVLSATTWCRYHSPNPPIYHLGWHRFSCLSSIESPNANPSCWVPSARLSIWLMGCRKSVRTTTIRIPFTKVIPCNPHENKPFEPNSGWWNLHELAKIAKKKPDPQVFGATASARHSFL